MSDWYATVAAEWKALVLATLTEITAPNFLTIVQALRFNAISEAIKALNGDTNRVAPPYFFLELGTETVATDQDPSQWFYYLPATFYYVIDKDPGGVLDAPAYARSRLELLRVAFQTPGDLTTCQWMGSDGVIDSSEDVAFADENMALFAASLKWDQGFLTLVT